MRFLGILHKLIDKFGLAKEYIEMRGFCDLLQNISKPGKHFLISQKRFNSFLSDIDLNSIKANEIKGEKLGILVTPWDGTAVSWFAITIALLYRKQGINVSIIWDDLLSYDEGYTKTEKEAISEILEKIKNVIDVIKLSNMEKESLDLLDLKEIDRLAKLKTIHHLKTSIVLNDTNKFRSLHSEVLRNSLPYIKTLFRQKQFGCFIVPGGICGNTALFYWASKLFNIRIASYDSGSGIFMVGVDDVASHLMDIPKIVKCNDVFNTLQDKNRAIKLARHELSLRMQGKDKFVSQHIPRVSHSNDKMNFDVLIPLNIDWDSAALGKHRFFEFTYEWLTDTIRYILDETTATIAVRQHPAEMNFKSGIFLEEYFNRIFPHEPRFRFFPCHEEVNTYDILDNVRIVLPYTSTLGVEAAMLGKRVIVESNCYYSNLSFVQKATSKQDYFNKIQNGLLENISDDLKVIEEAELCYYFTQVCNWIFTDFTPDTNDFKKWSNISLDKLLEDEIVQDILISFREGKLIPTLRSKKILETKGKES